MGKITHYELYSDNGRGWKLENRVVSDQRGDLMSLAKERERSGYAVKLIRESLDVEDNTYTETVEYIGGLSNKPSKAPKPSSNINTFTTPFSSNNKSSEEIEEIQNIPYKDLRSALIKLIIIVFVCLLFANIAVTLIEPLVDNFVGEEQKTNTTFLLFFSIFLFLAVPLVVMKMPWHLFGMKVVVKAKPVNEKKLFKKAEDIISLYNLTDKYQQVYSPSVPEASLEDKKYIVQFLAHVVSALDRADGIRGSFNKFGVKLVIYGGCMELSRVQRLSLGEANSLLYEAFRIIDGSKVDVDAFYEAKRSFSDNKIAIFLSGVGAYLMSLVINKHPIDSSLLNRAFTRWEEQNQHPQTEEKVPVEKIMYACTVNILSIIKPYDSFDETGDENIPIIQQEIKEILHNTIKSYNGANIQEEEGITSIDFNDLDSAYGFAKDFFSNLYEYQEHVNDENILIENKCEIVSSGTSFEMVKDIFEHIYDEEIIVTEDIKSSSLDSRYSFDYLGSKKLKDFVDGVALYKLIY